LRNLDAVLRELLTTC